MKTKKIVIVVCGKKDRDIDNALEAAITDILEEDSITGHRRTANGGYSFKTTSDVPEGEMLGLVDEYPA